MKSRPCQELLLLASLMILLGNRNPAWADQTNVTDASLAQLENRFFEHPYSKDTETDRLSRLEGFIFGSAQEGTVDERLKHILATVPKEEDNPPANVDTGKPAASANANAAAQSVASSDSGSLANGSTYPRVTSLEQELLGHTYADESLTKRLARLETKGLGAPSSSIDLSQRVDQLDQYADRHDLYGERRTASVPSPAQTNSIRPYVASPDGSQSQFVGSVSERLAMMEAQEFGKTYPEHSLDKRVKKLDEKVFPNDKKRFADKPLPDQVNALWLALHPKGNNAGTPSFGSSSDAARATDTYSGNGADGYQSANQDSGTGSSTLPANGQPHHGWLHALAKTAGTVGKVAVSSMSSYGGYPGYGGGFGGLGGYGGGYGGFPGGGYGGYGNGSYFGVPSNYGNTLPYSY